MFNIDAKKEGEFKLKIGAGDLLKEIGVMWQAKKSS
jgi:hypothetical protein